MHTHDFTACLFVSRGDLTLIRAEGSETFRAGDVCSLAAGIEHAERFGPEGASLLVGRKHGG